MEVRHHGQYYPACRGKCKPVLEWMLGSTLAPSPKEGRLVAHAADEGEEVSQWEWQWKMDDIAVAYEDEALLVVDKPAGLLSVPGKTGEPSVQSLLQERYGEVFMVHRLDQDTSGLMVVARTRAAHRILQQQFLLDTDSFLATDPLLATDSRGLTMDDRKSPCESAPTCARAIYKMYVALLDGEVDGRGTISLPLRPDVLDRPRQVADHEHGKAAVTHYAVLSHECGKTRVALTPHTGRTHQLRMHCAHREGLGVPIVGDRLYGHGAAKGQRLCLHAAELAFCHPLTGERMRFSSVVPF